MVASRPRSLHAHLWPAGDCASLQQPQHNPKGYADTERSIRTLKEECLWLQEWRSPFELADAVAGWFEQYNVSYLHSSLGYRSSESFEQ